MNFISENSAISILVLLLDKNKKTKSQFLLHYYDLCAANANASTHWDVYIVFFSFLI